MKKIISLLAVFLMLQGCTLEADFGLPICKENFNKIIGTYHNGDSTGKLTIESLKNHRYSLKVYENDLKTFNEVEFYFSKIKNHYVVNLYAEENNKMMYQFYRFRFKDNTLYFSEVTDKIRKNDFTSEKDLLQFFEKNVDNSDFFHSEESLTKDIAK